MDTEYVVVGPGGSALTKPLARIQAEHCASTWNAAARTDIYSIEPVTLELPAAELLAEHGIVAYIDQFVPGTAEHKLVAGRRLFTLQFPLTPGADKLR